MPTSLSAPLPAIPERSYETSPTEELPPKVLEIAQPAAPVAIVEEEKPEVKQEQEVLVIKINMPTICTLILSSSVCIIIQSL